jgi:hypothetical protein
MSAWDTFKKDLFEPGTALRRLFTLVVVAAVLIPLGGWLPGASAWVTSVTQSVIASCIVLAVELVSAARSRSVASEMAERERATAKALRDVIEDILSNELGEIITESMLLQIGVEQNVPPRQINSLLVRTTEAARKLERARGRLDAIIPATDEQISLPPRKHK